MQRGRTIVEKQVKIPSTRNGHKRPNGATAVVAAIVAVLLAGAVVGGVLEAAGRPTGSATLPPVKQTELARSNSVVATAQAKNATPVPFTPAPAQPTATIEPHIS